MMRLSGLCRITVACAVCLLAGASLPAQTRTGEGGRERWQKVDEIFAALRLTPGATVADVGSGDGFFTTRLARAVGASGRVIAVDIDDRALDRLRRRLEEQRIENVTVVKGAAGDPKLPEGALDAALIVNAYHEMREHQSILAAIRRALKPDGRLVLVEPVRDSRRGRPRDDQVRDHEIDPEYVLREARAAGFRIVGLVDPFTVRNEDVEWLMALQPADSLPAPATAVSETPRPTDAALNDPALRIPLEALETLLRDGAATIVDVREEESFAEGHIPGALSIPLETVADAAERLRRLGKPIVTYCS
jgi:predicted methyltransferase